jgi:hypothetical protein
MAPPILLHERAATQLQLERIFLTYFLLCVFSIFYD